MHAVLSRMSHVTGLSARSSPVKSVKPQDRSELCSSQASQHGAAAPEFPAGLQMTAAHMR